MAFLKLPLQVTQMSNFEISNTHEDYMKTRLRLFILSGIKKYFLLPTPGISMLWIQLTTIGPTSKFCQKDVFPERERKKLENLIQNEVNHWIVGGSQVLKVEILGDERQANGIKFVTEDYEYIFSFTFAMPGKGLRKDAIGNWNIEETVNVIY